jgi:nitronate monooxygenase
MMYTTERVRDEVGKFRERSNAPLSLAFFTHKPTPPDNAREAAWRNRLKP